MSKIEEILLQIKLKRQQKKYEQINFKVNRECACNQLSIKNKIQKKNVTKWQHKFIEFYQICKQNHTNMFKKNL